MIDYIDSSGLGVLVPSFAKLCSDDSIRLSGVGKCPRRSDQSKFAVRLEGFLISSPDLATALWCPHRQPDLPPRSGFASESQAQTPVGKRTWSACSWPGWGWVWELQPAAALLPAARSQRPPASVPLSKRFPRRSAGPGPLSALEPLAPDAAERDWVRPGTATGPGVGPRRGDRPSMGGPRDCEEQWCLALSAGTPDGCQQLLESNLNSPGPDPLPDPPMTHVLSAAAWGRKDGDSSGRPRGGKPSRSSGPKRDWRGSPLVDSPVRGIRHRGIG